MSRKKRWKIINLNRKNDRNIREHQASRNIRQAQVGLAWILAVLFSTWYFASIKLQRKLQIPDLNLKTTPTRCTRLSSRNISKAQFQPLCAQSACVSEHWSWAAPNKAFCCFSLGAFASFVTAISLYFSVLIIWTVVQRPCLMFFSSFCLKYKISHLKEHQLWKGSNLTRTLATLLTKWMQWAQLDDTVLLSVVYASARPLSRSTYDNQEFW